MQQPISITRYSYPTKDLLRKELAYISPLIGTLTTETSLTQKKSQPSVDLNPRQLAVYRP